MCLDIDPEIKTLKNRVVWKVFDKETGKIASLHRGAVYPKGKLVERSPGPTTMTMFEDIVVGTRGLHFFRSKALALAEARALQHNTYIAKNTLAEKQSRGNTSTPSKPMSQQYKPGERVRHDKFGDGIILKSEMEQNTEFVEVQFQGKHGKKRLSLDFAKLEKI